MKRGDDMINELKTMILVTIFLDNVFVQCLIYCRTYRERHLSPWMRGLVPTRSHSLQLFFTILRQIGVLVGTLSSSDSLMLRDCIEEVLIDFKEIVGAHTGENMANLVWETMILYGLKGKVSN